MSLARFPTGITLHQKSRILEVAFSDGHSTGIFSWDYLYELGENQEELCADYLARLAQAGASRDA